MMVVERLQQLEFLIKIGPLQGSHSEEIFSSDNEPKYKRPRVSAVRDFPPGCGRFATSVGMDMTPQRREVVRDFPPNCGIKVSLEAKAFDQVKKPGVEVHDKEFHNSELKVNVSQASGGNLLPRNMEYPRKRSVEISNFHDDLLEDDVQRSDLKLNKVTPSLKPVSPPSLWKGKVAHKSKPGGGGGMRERQREKPFHDDLLEEGVQRLEVKLNKATPSLKHMSPPSWWKGKVAHKSKPGGGGGMGERQREKPDAEPQLEGSKDAWKTKVGSEIGGHTLKNIHSIARKTTGVGQASSSSSLHENNMQAIRKKVTETLGQFKAMCRQLEYDKSMGRTSVRRVDFEAAKILKKEGKYMNQGKQILGHVPGIEVGDEFHYRIELNIVGLHHPIQAGIDYATFGWEMLATSIVASGGYADDLHNLNSLTYTGQGGNVMHPDKEPEDQKLERGNLALKNSMNSKTPVRMIRGFELPDGKTKHYIYDGLYKVVKCKKEMGHHGKLVFKFQLDRIEGQSSLRKR